MSGFTVPRTDRFLTDEFSLSERVRRGNFHRGIYKKSEVRRVENRDSKGSRAPPSFMPPHENLRDFSAAKKKSELR